MKDQGVNTVSAGFVLAVKLRTVYARSRAVYRERLKGMQTVQN